MLNRLSFGSWHLAFMIRGSGVVVLGGLVSSACSRTSETIIDAVVRDSVGSSELDASVESSVSGGLAVQDSSVLTSGVSVDAGKNTNQRLANFTPLAAGQTARNVILMIADGYGPQQIEATRMFLNAGTALLSFEQFPFETRVTTFDAARRVTDSAASASAMATGRKVSRYVVSVALPGDGSDQITALEIQASRGKSTGLVTTHTELADATPAAFGSHDATRASFEALANDMLNDTRPQVLLGGPSPGFTRSAAEAAGYHVVTTTAGFLNLEPMDLPRVAGWFEEPSPPPLVDMAKLAIAVLERNSDGFFLLIEQERTDSAGHKDDLPKVLQGAVEFEKTVKWVSSWVDGRDDTLLVVGADHETGGLVLTESEPVVGQVPAHIYTSGGVHTGIPVPFFAKGPRAEQIVAARDNRDLFPLLSGLDAVRLGGPGEPVAVTLALRQPGGDVVVPEAEPLRIDLDGEGGGGTAEVALISFPALPEAIVTGGTLRKAYLELEVLNGSGTGVSLYRLLTPWSSDTTWSSFGSEGPVPGSQGVAVERAGHLKSQSVGIATFDVTDSIRQWLDGSETPYGWLLAGDGGDGMTIDGANGGVAPRLRIYSNSP